MSIELKEVSITGSVWRYRIAGANQKAVLVLPGSLGGGDAITDLMTQTIPERKIVVPEYSPVATVSECIEGVDEILRREQIETTAVYGCSFGGLLAQCFARTHPDHVTHLILSGTGFPEQKRAKGNRRLLALLPFLRMRLMRFLLRMVLWKLLRKVTVDKNQWKNEFHHLMSKLTRDDLASRYKIAIDFDENYRFTPADLSGWPGKILILEGSADRIANERIRAELRSLYPQAAVHTFSEAGHSMFLTHTQEWGKIVSAFLDA